MKFTKNRLLSLLLVLAMMLALVPTVFAGGGEGGSVTIGDVSTLTVGGGKVALPTATCSADSGKDHDIDFSITEGNAVSIVEESSVKKLSPDHKGTATLTATCECGATETKVLTVSAKTIPVFTDAQKTISAVAPLNCSADVATGKLTDAYNAVIASMADKNQLSAPTWTLNPDTQNYGTESSKENGTLTYTATITSKSEDYVLADGQSVTITGTVTFKKAPEVTFGKYYVNETKESRTLNCVQGETTDSKKSITVTLATITEGAKVEYQWYKGTSASAISTPIGSSKTTLVESATSSNNNSPISTTADVSSTGTTYYKLVVTVSKDGIKQEYPSDYFTVTVGGQYQLTLGSVTGTTTVGKRVYVPVYVQKFDRDAGEYKILTSNSNSSEFYRVTYELTTGSTRAALVSTYSTLPSSSAYIDLKGSGSVMLTAKLYLTSSGSAVDSKQASLSVTYPTASPIQQNPTYSTYTLLNMSQLNEAVATATYNSSIPASSTPYYYKLTGVNGSFSTTGASSTYRTDYLAYASSTSTYFVPDTNYSFASQNCYVRYVAYDSYDNAIANGIVQFTSASSITYSTTANTPVTFSYSDFLDFYQKSTYKNATLSTISITGQPTVTSGSGTVGTLYYNGYSYNSTSYTRSYFTSISASNIGYISYTPSSSLTKYTVSIPFSLTGSSYAVSGTVTIKVNDGHVITMVGTDFKSASIWDDVRSSYPSVDYVRFSQPQSTVGKLYYGYTSIANKGSYVSSTDSFKNQNLIYSQASTYKSIDGVYFVPAADCLNTVTLSYTAYNGNTALGYGTITFTITKKTASSIFNDVTASNTGKWSADAIDFLARNSIVEGGSYGTFNPNGNMTRGDFVLMLYRLAGKPSVSGISNPFTDVKSSDYYYNAILWAYRNDIVTGVDAKTFAPKKNITREQIAATLYRMAGSPSASGYLTGYYDYAKIHSYATNAMRWAISNGVITGSNGYLTPTNNATRAQVATMLHRYLTK